MSDFAQRAIVSERLLDLHGGDPFDDVIRRADAHRALHGSTCGLYPAGPQVMRLVAAIVRMTSARRIIDLGAGFGYSALWMASACEPDARIEAIDRFPEHVAVAEDLAR